MEIIAAFVAGALLGAGSREPDHMGVVRSEYHV